MSAPMAKSTVKTSKTGEESQSAPKTPGSLTEDSTPVKPRAASPTPPPSPALSTHRPSLIITIPLSRPVPTLPQSNPATSTAEARVQASRRTAIRTLQATRYPHLAGQSEPNLNDPSEVRHFEVDSQGSLTFILLDGGEAWRLREVGLDSTERGQMVVGRFYVVERV